MRRRGIRIGLLSGGALAALALGAGPAAAATPLHGNLELTQSLDLTTHEGDSSAHLTLAVSAATSETSPGETPWQFRSLSGSVVSTGSAEIQPPNNCSASFSAGHSPTTPSFYQQSEGEAKVTVASGTPIGVLGAIASSEEGGQCSAGDINQLLLVVENEIAIKESSAALEKFRNALNPNGEVAASGNPVLNGEDHVAISDGDSTYDATVSSTLSIAIGASSTPGAPTGTLPGSPPPPVDKNAAEKARKKMKEAARSDFKPAFEALSAGAGLGTLLELAAGRGLSKIVDEVAGPSARFSGTDATTRVLNDYRIVEDPPAADYTELARAKRGGGAKPSGKGLAGAAGALARSGAATSAVTAAMVTTIDRDSGAIKAGDYAAAAKQAKQFTKLEGELADALKAQGEAGAALAKLLKGAGLKSTLTRSEDAKLIASLEKSLTKKGLSVKALKPLAGGLLKPAPLDVLTALARG
jgi:hypothetical protein